MNKRKIKKKFHLTCKEFKFMTMNNPNIFKNISRCLYSFFICVSLPYRLCFVKGKRVSREEYDAFTEKIENNTSHEQKKIKEKVPFNM